MTGSWRVVHGMLLRQEVQAWRDYAQQQESSPDDETRLTRAQLKALQDQHLEAFQCVFAKRQAIEEFCPAADGSPNEEYDKGLRMAAVHLHLEGMRFRGEVPDLGQSGAGARSGDELTLRAVIGRAMSAARNQGEIFH